MTSTQRQDTHPGPIVIGHRGACGYRPEHTLASYRLAIEQGADFIEPDLVATRDGVLVARHENEISATTDVAGHTEFADRRTTKVIDGRARTGWFTEDFTLAELRTLRAKERIPAVRPDNTRYDGMFPIPTFAEVIRLAQSESRGGRMVGVYPETKHPTWFAGEGRHLDGSPIGISLGRLLVETLVAEGFTDPCRVYIQSFEVANLIELKQAVMPAAGVEFPLVQLLGELNSDAPYDFGWNAARGADLDALYGGFAAVIGGIDADTRYHALATEAALAWMRANYASGLGPWKGDLLPHGPPATGADAEGDGSARSEPGHPAPPPLLLAHALKAGLVVHPYTLRAEEHRLAPLPPGIAPPVVAEAVRLFGLGVQGVFIDQPDLGVVARNYFLGRGEP